MTKLKFRTIESSLSNRILEFRPSSWEDIAYITHYVSTCLAGTKPHALQVIQRDLEKVSLGAFLYAQAGTRWPRSAKLRKDEFRSMLEELCQVGVLVKIFKDGMERWQGIEHRLMKNLFRSPKLQTAYDKKWGTCHLERAPWREVEACFIEKLSPSAPENALETMRTVYSSALRHLHFLREHGIYEPDMDTVLVVAKRRSWVRPTIPYVIRDAAQVVFKPPVHTSERAPNIQEEYGLWCENMYKTRSVLDPLIEVRNAQFSLVAQP